MRAIVLITAILLSACGGAQYGYGASTGIYHGPNVLDFAVTRPIVRRMPPEQHVGSVEVIDSGGSYVTLELRMLEEGETPCRVQAQRVSAAELTVVPGQRCASRFRYDGHPLVAVTEIREGVATFAGNQIRVLMRGPFAADVQTSRGVAPADGLAVWEFRGSR